VSTLPHEFTNPAHLALALRHASVGPRNNERLEFLGDTVLDLIVAEELFHHHEEEREGALTEMKSEVVSRHALAEASRSLRLADLAQVGPGMRGREMPISVMANLYEAVLGAVYLDAGLEASRAFVLVTLAEPLGRVRRQENEPNPKQELQRVAQLQTGEPPEYRLIEERGNAQARAFLIEAKVGPVVFPSAWGRTRKEAEKWAAFEALLVIGSKASDKGRDEGRD
jgi:ribonuclease-3